MADAPVQDAAESIPSTSRNFSGYLPLLGLLVGVGIVFPWTVWKLLQEPELTPYEKTLEALDLLDQGRTRTAYIQAMQMLHNDVAGPEIGGSLEYIVGVAHFRKAERMANESYIENKGLTGPVYDLAKRYLEQASRKSLVRELKPNWSYALGACYYKLGEVYQAREMLENAAYDARIHKAHILQMLGDCYRDSNVLKSSLLHPNSLAEAEEKRNKIILRLAELTEEAEGKKRQIQMHFIVADLQRQNKLLNDANATIKQIRELFASTKELQELQHRFEDQLALLEANIHLDRGEPAQARKMLEELIGQKSSLAKSFSLEGHFLMAQTYAEEGRDDQAIQHLEKATQVRGSEVCFPANLYAGEISRARAQHESALNYYLQALSLVQSTDHFANKWIELDVARQMIQAAWDEWGGSERYEHFRFSLELAQQMVPLFPQAHANQLAALASRKRAELKQEELDRTSRPLEDAEIRVGRELWKRAGQAYARLANSSRASSTYSQTLWDAAIFYHKGNDFTSALHMLDRFIATKPRTGIPDAMLMKAKVMINIDPYQEEDRIVDAIAVLHQLLEDYPRDQTIYEAQLLLGEAYLEHQQPEEAVRVWRSLISESPLTPEASEWQTALFSLGRLLFQISDLRASPFGLKQQAEQETENEENDKYIDEAIAWLDEFVRRIPEHERNLEARWLLAKGLRYRGRRPASRLKTAETENTRMELLNEINELWKQSSEEFDQLGKQLALLDQRNELDSVTAQLLRDCYLEPAHIQFDLGMYDESGDAYREAIDLYSNAAFHFTGDPVVLIAYYRIAECYRHLNAEDEARRQLEQARVILNQIPEPFSQQSTNFSKKQWEQIIDQFVKLYGLALDDAQPALN